MENNQDNMLREINNDNLTPKKKKLINEDGFFQVENEEVNISDQQVLNEF
jgi:hypothetical protein